DFNQYEENTKYSNTIIVAGTSEDLRNDLLLLVKQSLVQKKQVILVHFEKRPTTASWSPRRLSGHYAELIYPASSEEPQHYDATSVCGGLAISHGPNTTYQTRLQYGTASSRGFDLEGMVKKSDAIATAANRARATPGMVVMGIKNEQVVLEKGYGTHT